MAYGSRMPSLVQPLFEGPVDVVGDVHGHLAALRKLMDRLGYDEEGGHPEGRRLVFVGDLVDRGEDSPGVIRLVRAMVEAGRAQCVLGNHELNLLLGKVRAGNEWFRGLPQLRHGRLLPQVLIRPSERGAILDWLRTLPLALERADLRVVHACWEARAIDRARRMRDVVGDIHARRLALRARLRPESDEDVRDLIHQNRNPVSVLTSGRERHARQPFRAGGKLRRTERVAWWEEYHDRTAVVFGHYWRSPFRHRPLKAVPGPFHCGGGGDPFGPLGPRHNAWCVDYSTGYQNEELLQQPWKRETEARLGALRWPEGAVVSVSGGL